MLGVHQLGDLVQLLDDLAPELVGYGEVPEHPLTDAPDGLSVKVILTEGARGPRHSFAIFQRRPTLR